MAMPATTGVLRTKIADMEIGDYIIATYNLAQGGFYKGNFGRDFLGTEIPYEGMASPANHSFTLIKVSEGMLVADRVVQHSVSWDSLNTKKLIQGTPYASQFYGTGSEPYDNSLIIRSLTGGVAYADANGNSSTTDLGFGAFPTNNEWDKYIVNFPADKIQSGKTSDDVWHHLNIASWVQETSVNGLTHPSSGIGANTQRMYRGYHLGNFKGVAFTISSGTGATFGFRPVFEYKEV